MLSVLTAGDKHFFRHIETLKKQTGISLNLWGINPLEVTPLQVGLPRRSAGLRGGARLQPRRHEAAALPVAAVQAPCCRAPATSTGRFPTPCSASTTAASPTKSDYFHIFDYWRWDEKQIEDTLDSEYDWERAPDTQTTWRIGDGTAAFYNYVYYTIAGFTEHDTFRSNQVREGDITREEALRLVEEENTPRYPNLKWYLDVVGVDFTHAIDAINRAPRLYEEARRARRSRSTSD